MKLVHFSNREVTKVRSSRQWKLSSPDARHKKRPHRQTRGSIGKPSGFWISVEERDSYGWKQWCEDQNFRLDNLVYEYEVTLQPETKILYLRSAEDIDKFTEEYADRDSPIYKLLNSPTDNFRSKPDVMDIVWHRVAKEYQGIIIAPYIWERRLAIGYSWYYGWDCASGCIWDTTAIKSLKRQEVKND